MKKFFFFFVNNLYTEKFFFNSPYKNINISKINIEIPHIEFNFSILNFKKYYTEIALHGQSLNYFYFSINKLFSFNEKLINNFMFYFHLQGIIGLEKVFFYDFLLSIDLNSLKYKYINLSIGYCIIRKFVFIKYNFIKISKISFSLYCYVKTRNKDLNKILKKYDINDNVKEILKKVTKHESKDNISFDLKYYTAAHEAGHAISNYFIGNIITSFNIITKNDELGSTKYLKYPQPYSDEIITKLAGIIGEEIMARQVSDEECRRMRYHIFLIDKIDEIIENPNKQSSDLKEVFKIINTILSNSNKKILDQFNINEEDTKEIKIKKILSKSIKNTENLIKKYKKEHELLTKVLIEAEEIKFNKKFTFENLMKSIQEYLKNDY